MDVTIGQCIDALLRILHKESSSDLVVTAKCHLAITSN